MRKNKRYRVYGGFTVPTGSIEALVRTQEDRCVRATDRPLYRALRITGQR